MQSLIYFLFSKSIITFQRFHKYLHRVPLNKKIFQNKMMNSCNAFSGQKEIQFQAFTEIN